jgi:uncharacterized membrane protein
VSSVRVARPVELDPAAAFELWIDISRWPTFVDGFGHVERIDEGWPAVGSKLVWRSPPTGRGIVTERVTAIEPGTRFAARVFEERLTGTQTVEFATLDGGGCEVAVQLEYELQGGGPIHWLVDVIFIRRAQRDALMRTLRRFAVDAAEQAAL